MTDLRESWLLQVLLPVHDNAGRVFPNETWEKIKDRLVQKFGGLTVYRRSPAEGVWAPEGRKALAEDVFIIEVMTPDFDDAWWRTCQRDLEVQLRQEHIVVRAIKFAELGRQETQVNK